MKTLLANKHFLLLLLICVLTILPFLGMTEYHTKGEPRESIVSYTMLTGDNWTLPRNNGGEMAYKPPFFHWCVAAVSALNGAVTEASSRLPSALALILMTLWGFVFYARRTHSSLALTAALVTLTSFELHRAGSNCRVDMVLTALIVCALYALYRWVERGGKGLPLTAIILMGLGTMTKGPIGSILPCLGIGLFMLLRKQPFWRTFLTLCGFGLLSLLLYGAWFYVAWQQGGDEFLSLMYDENIGRMTGTMSYPAHDFHWTFNILTVILGYLPWTLLPLTALFFVRWRCSQQGCRMSGGWFRTLIAQARQWWQRLLQMPDVELFSLVNLVSIFVFYCIPSSKRSVYLMPIYPFIGYFLAKWMLWLADNRPKILRAYGSVLAVLSALLFVVFIIVKLQVVPESIFGHGRHAEANVLMLRAMEQIGGFGSWCFVLLPTVAGLAWWVFVRRVRQGSTIVPAILALVFCLYLSLDGLYIPTAVNTKSLKAISAEIDRVAPASEGRLYEYIEEGVKAKGDPLHFFEVNFYLHDRIGSFHHEKPQSGFLLISRKDMEKNKAGFAREGYQFEPVYQASKRGLMVYKFSR